MGSAVIEGVEDSEGEQRASPASMAKGKSESYGDDQHESDDGKCGRRTEQV